MRAAPMASKELVGPEGEEASGLYPGLLEASDLRLQLCPSPKVAQSAEVPRSRQMRYPSRPEHRVRKPTHSHSRCVQPTTMLNSRFLSLPQCRPASHTRIPRHPYISWELKDRGVSAPLIASVGYPRNGTLEFSVQTGVRP